MKTTLILFAFSFFITSNSFASEDNACGKLITKVKDEVKNVEKSLDSLDDNFKNFDKLVTQKNFQAAVRVLSNINTQITSKITKFEKLKDFNESDLATCRSGQNKRLNKAIEELDSAIEHMKRFKFYAEELSKKLNS